MPANKMGKQTLKNQLSSSRKQKRLILAKGTEPTSLSRRDFLKTYLVDHIISKTNLWYQLSVAVPGNFRKKVLVVEEILSSHEHEI